MPATTGVSSTLPMTLQASTSWPMRMVDVRHEQTAVFAAEATARLTRAPGLAVVTAGPGVTNTVSAITTAWFNGSPVVVLGGRAPDYRWGSGGLQEIDHPPLLAPVTSAALPVALRASVCHSLLEMLRTAQNQVVDLPPIRTHPPGDA